MVQYANIPGGQQLVVVGTPPATSIPVFGGSGPGHSTGGVPDPGASVGTTRFLREDATWAVVPEFFINAATEFDVDPANSAALNTTNINAALTAASTTSGRGTVVLPSGVLQISGALNIPAGCRLVGQGIKATTLESTASITTMCSITGAMSEVRDLSITVTAGHTVTNGILINGTAVNECDVARANIDAAIGSGTITNGVQISGVSGGYFNRVRHSRINGCTNGVNLSGPNALEALLDSLDIGSGSIGVLASSGCAYFSMIKVEALSCSSFGLSTSNSNYEAVDCLMDSSGTCWSSDFSTTTGMPITGWYLRMTNCRASNSASATGFHITNSGSGAGSILNLNMTGCGAYNNGGYGFLITSPGTAANTRAMIAGCVASRNAVSIASDGFYFNFVHVSSIGNGAFNTGAGVNLGDGIIYDTGCTGRSTGNIGSNNTGQNVNVTPTSAVISINDDANLTRTVAQLPAAAAAGAGARAYVTDSIAVTFSTIVAGTGVSVVPVYSDGTNWRIG